jgi:hypothetical protein
LSMLRASHRELSSFFENCQTNKRQINSSNLCRRSDAALFHPKDSMFVFEQPKVGCEETVDTLQMTTKCNYVIVQ